MMAGGTSFTMLDLSHAYLQLQLADSAREYLVINTHKGLFQYTRMPFGIKSAPAIFQRTMDNLLQGLDHVGVYIDDILITGKSEEQHLATLNEVLSRLEKAGVRLKQEKCVFMADEVTYLGHRLNREGIQPTGAKVEAINQAIGAASLSGNGELLWEVYGESLYSTRSVVQAAQEGSGLAMGEAATSSIRRGQRVAQFTKTLGSL